MREVGRKAENSPWEPLGVAGGSQLLLEASGRHGPAPEKVEKVKKVSARPGRGASGCWLSREGSASPRRGAGGASESSAPSDLSCPIPPGRGVGAPFQRLSPRSESKPQSSLCTKHPPRLPVSGLSAWLGAEGSARKRWVPREEERCHSEGLPARRPAAPPLDSAPGSWQPGVTTRQVLSSVKPVVCGGERNDFNKIFQQLQSILIRCVPHNYRF